MVMLAEGEDARRLPKALATIDTTASRRGGVSARCVEEIAGLRAEIISGRSGGSDGLAPYVVWAMIEEHLERCWVITGSTISPDVQAQLLVALRTVRTADACGSGPPGPASAPAAAGME